MDQLNKTKTVIDEYVVGMSIEEAIEFLEELIDHCEVILQGLDQ